ncbi:DEAD/DEAH box helicase [Helicobacter sp.]|uniref:DEAD/DEAH box helicase n=1 Tax=Helicobacter sp. TaxID=218 RepID=UPI002A74DBC0|nr:DEAD/DEAH box helicase family protein [Helicobacter sp.]MDY2584022.1 DEAD/DEAH box helicase family protein [Helicobacter sp.]
MTQAALELQQNAVQSLLYLAKQNQKDITLKAPTGSGKTRMMAAFMNAMLDFNPKVVFLVSTLSKGKLATQNYESFVELANACIYPKLKPFYISSGAENSKNTEYSLDIDTNANVYVLPTNQFTKSSRIYKERTLLKFLQNIKESGKKIILIRDEAHIATNKLENELQEYFTQILHFSATPKNDKFDVEIKESEAVEAGLIKSVEWCGDSERDLQEDLTEALEKFKELREVYAKQGINPCFIVQISNEGKAENELEIIKKVVEEMGLRWVCFVEKEKGYETNTRLDKVKNKALWQKYVKENSSFIDVVIFKMVITEGFDMPRACMLYQVRDSKSSSLDMQVIGRVRRNPMLKEFERLDSKTQEVFSKAYIYGIKPKENGRKKVWLKGEKQIYDDKSLYQEQTNEIIKEFRPFYATMYKEVPKEHIDIESCISPLQEYEFKKSIFQAYREIQQCDDKVREKYAEYVREFRDFYSFSANLDSIKNKVKSVVENYDEYLESQCVEIREDVYSFYEESEFNTESESWIWRNDNSDNDEFGLDSQAEKEWCKVLRNLAKTYAKSIEINGEKIYLFGKNFIEKSNIKYEYYDERKRVSYPDFIFVFS